MNTLKRIIIVSRSLIVVLVAFLLLSTDTHLWAQKFPEEPKFNVLFISVDDLRPVLGCYGHKVVKTPNIDQLAATGTLFKRAYCHVPSCCPSRTSVLTGLRSETTGVEKNSSPHFRKTLPDCLTLPQYFKNLGAISQSLGKVYHLMDDPSWSEHKWNPTPQESFPIYAKSENIAIQKKQNAKPAGTGIWFDKYPKEKAASWEDPDVPDNQLFDGQLADKAISLLNENRNKRFFLATGFYRPHLPFIAPRKYYDLYPFETLKLPENRKLNEGSPEFAVHTMYEVRTYHDLPMEGEFSEQKHLELLRGYYASVTYVDAQIGRVLRELDRLQLRDKTIIVLWGDHGYHHGEQGIWCKYTNFEVSAHAPLMVSAPGIQPSVTEGLVELLDIYPTVCELAGIRVPENLEGISMVPLMRSPNRPWKKAAFTRATPRTVPGFSMRTDRYRYVRWVQDGTILAEEVYDHEKDNAETTNLAKLPEHGNLLKILRKQFDGGWRSALPDAE